MESRDITLVKLGGGLITNKDKSPKEEPVLIEKAVTEVITLLKSHAGPLILAHGNGSFGHPVAHAHAERIGSRQWDEQAAREIRAATLSLNQVLFDRLMEAGLPVVRFFTERHVHRVQTSLEMGDLPETLERVLDRGKVPLLYGALIDGPRSFEVLSADALLAELGLHLKGRVKEAWFLSKASGVLDGNSAVIPQIHASDISDLLANVIQAHHDTIDVSGGMRQKLEKAGKLAKLEIPVFIGRPEGLGQNKGTWVLPG